MALVIGALCFYLGIAAVHSVVFKEHSFLAEIKYKNDMPRWVVPDLTFQEYVRLVTMAYENLNEKIEE